MEGRDGALGWRDGTHLTLFAIKIIGFAYEALAALIAANDSR